MGQARNKQLLAFSPEQVVGWEADDCVNFAVALARLSGWLLHVDWWATSQNPRLDQIHPLRVYVGDSGDKVFDVRGIRTIDEFNRRIILDLGLRAGRTFGRGGVLTRYYAESKLASLPLRSQPDEEKVRLATDAIRANSQYLGEVPSRRQPNMPAHEAAGFTFGRCGPFAEAMHELTGLQPVALLAVRFLPNFQHTQRGNTAYFHSVVLHPDGNAEDSWGIAPLKDIAARYGVVEFSISIEEHSRVMNKLRTNTPENYERALKHAKELIQQYRL